MGDSYRSAGVDVDAFNALKERIGAFASITHGPEVLKGIGAFAGLYRLSGYSDPVLVASTDGVGTKVKVATLLGHFDSLGKDLVYLNVNDVITCGADPVIFLDYISIGELELHVIEPLIRGISWACREVGCALIGGETAQSPGLYQGDNFDLAGTLVGVVEGDGIIDTSKVKVGDVVLGLPSSGIHTNGLSLVRKVFDIDNHPSVLFERYEDLGHTLGEELMIPHRCYYPMLRPHYSKMKAIAHITGGGLIGKIPAVLPEGLAVTINPDNWNPLPIFEMIERIGRIGVREMFEVFNMGIGMILICDPKDVSSLRLGLPDVDVVGEVIRQREDGYRVSLDIS